MGNVDLLYLDPPWYTDSNEKISLEDMITFIQTNVLQPLKEKKFQPRVICFKLDFPKEDIRRSAPFQGLLDGFQIGPTVDVVRGSRTAYSFYTFIALG